MIELNLVASTGTYLFAIGMLTFLMTIVINWTVLMLAGQDGAGPGNYLFYLVLKDGKFFNSIKIGLLSGALLIVAGALIFGIGILISLFI